MFAYPKTLIDSNGRVCFWRPWLNQQRCDLCRSTFSLCLLGVAVIVAVGTSSARADGVELKSTAAPSTTRPHPHGAIISSGTSNLTSSSAHHSFNNNQPVRPEAVTIELITGQQLQSDLHALTADGWLLDGNQGRLAELSQVLSIRFGRPLGVKPDSAWIALPGNGKLAIEQLELANDRVTFKSVLANQDLPLEAIRGVVWQPHERVTATLSAPLADQDQVVVQTPDSVVVVSGLLESVDNEKLKMDFQGESRTIARDKVLAIVLANLDANRAKASVGVATCQLLNGDSISGKLLEMTSDQFRVQLDSQTEIAFPTALISAIELVSDRLLHLTEISPTVQEQRSWFALQRPWQLDRNITGQPLKLKMAAGQPPLEFGRGFGLSAFTRLAFDIPPGFDRLQAIVGIDATTADRGDCQVSVLGDGIRLWSGRVQGVGVAEKIDVDISNAKQLEIIVDPGQNFDLADHLNVVNPRLLKTK